MYIAKEYFSNVNCTYIQRTYEICRNLFNLVFESYFTTLEVDLDLMYKILRNFLILNLLQCYYVA